MAGERIEGLQPASLARPKGHYAHGVRVRGWVFVAGQLPLLPDGTPLTGAPFEQQVAQVLANVDGVLAAADACRDQLVQVRVYITDIEQWPLFDALYGAWLGPHRPARAVVPVPRLHYGVQLEVEAIAAT